ncbi:enoyl-ACP reductase FabV [Pedobacter nyackensis]|uniref:Enoyl-[acyl-carrier-protein] reductase [NADH] n=1 Tax=Pedobacter nyackensis TaxID=475255 RepID=A0A1W2F939_9SPHI|nr:enoyl-ACP reductase FabV [Pedobacter nyackensis]SMD18373.1 enoyl-[acyl-carrier protein] reductase / trans-2-enoyl-CoA reductase (NAD+) [Pedobacter nyackensis]
MIIEPKMRGFICLTSHPDGCEQNVINQINYVKSKGAIAGPKKVLVIGASTGFGLASRITSAFGSDAATIGVFFEKPPAPGKPASPGWYNSAAFEKEAIKAGLYAKSINGDAFSDEIKQKTLDLIKSDLGQIDLVIYSLASPKRVHPKTGVVHNSVLKPIGDKPFENKTVDFHTGIVSEVSIAPANEEEIENTVAVMGGEDWEMWIDALKTANLLAEGANTVAYSYIGPSLTEAVYRKGTIGRAKDHLEATAFTIGDKLKDLNGKAFVSVNKALVTQASSAIPVIPLYISLLYKVMKEEGIHEGCIEQIQRLFAERLYAAETPTDSAGRIRVDDLEMRDAVQAKVAQLWTEATAETLPLIGDLAGYKKDFLNLFGFDVAGIDYAKDVNEMVEIPGLV